jgi:hypothetical protein
MFMIVLTMCSRLWEIDMHPQTVLIRGVGRHFFEKSSSRQHVNGSTHLKEVINSAKNKNSDVIGEIYRLDSNKSAVIIHLQTIKLPKL